jgi:O-antigen/teichoic acid export membrane protein
MRSAAADPSIAEGGLNSASLARPRILVNLSQLLGSNLLVGLAGLACLPILARSFGPAGYGSFSLFVAILGVLSNLDFSRPVLVRELSREPTAARGKRLRGLCTCSAWLLSPVAFVLGALVCGPLAGAGLAVAVAAFALASGPYARLAADGRIGIAGAVRNLAWTLALLCVAALSFAVPLAHAFVWPFVTANVAILLVYRQLCGESATSIVPRFDRRILRRHAADSRDVLGFSAAIAIMISSDRLILDRCAPRPVLGQYTGQYDLATKINILSTALGSVLYPMFARHVRESGLDRATARFVRISSWVALGYFLLIWSLMVFDEEIVALVLGREFLGAFNGYVLLLFGVFLHLFGFLITPWQRARGDFATHRRAYVLAAGIMLAVGLVAIPLLGPMGAALCYLSGRSAELLLLSSEIRRIPRRILPRWKLACLAGMLLLLAYTAAHGLITGGLAA